MRAPRPPLRHGVDLVHLPQLRDAMMRNASFEARVFTEAERDYCNSRPNSLAHFAARFAAKEAALKALGMGITPLGIDAALGEVEVVREGSAPHLRLRGRPARRAARLGLVPASVSLSHAGDNAIASVILLREEAE
jgi:holo-[acyl-carrier protein] synthase